MNKRFLSIIFLPLVISNINSSSTQVKNYVKSETTGDNASVETNINTKVNQTETTVKTNQPGEVEVKVNNDKVEVKTSKGVMPTIIIDSGQITPIRGEIKIDESKIEKEQVRQDRSEFKVYLFLKDFFKNIFNLFHR